MKKTILLLSFLMSAGLAGRAQNADNGKASTADGAVTLSGVSGPVIHLKEIKEKPVVAVIGQPSGVASFDFAWVNRNAAGANEYVGPVHCAGNSLSTIALSQLEQASAKGTVTRVYIDKVILLRPDGKPASAKWGASYQIVP